MLEHDHLLPDFGGEDRAVLLLGDEAQADDAGVIVELALEIGRGQRRVANSLDLQHGVPPYPPGLCARTGTAISPIGSILASIVSPGFTGLTPSGVPV